MNILDKIVAYKRREVDDRKKYFPVSFLEKSAYFQSPVISLKNSLLTEGKSGIIAEFKRKSPSQGAINANASIENTAVGYAKAGASALSVLTDSSFFGGSNEDLLTARNVVACPILRKEFVVDEYQIVEAKSIGADAILLIAAVLDPVRIRQFTQLANSLTLEVLLEVHEEDELSVNLSSGVDLIGVNNRNLKTFEVNIETSKRIAPLIPNTMTKISESGIDNPSTIQELCEFGYRGFLLGQVFMQQSKPDVACKEFIDAIQKIALAKAK